MVYLLIFIFIFILVVWINSKQSPQKENNKESQLMKAVIQGDFEKVKYLVSCEADVNVKNHHGYTPLKFAILHGRIEIIDFLIQKGANLNDRNKHRETPLIEAIDISNDHPEISMLLIAKGADIHVRDKLGATPLIWACIKGNLAIVKFLLDYGADPSVRANNGCLAIDFAKCWKRWDIVNYLTEIY